MWRWEVVLWLWLEFEGGKGRTLLHVVRDAVLIRLEEFVGYRTTNIGWAQMRRHNNNETDGQKTATTTATRKSDVETKKEGLALRYAVKMRCTLLSGGVALELEVSLIEAVVVLVFLLRGQREEKSIWGGSWTVSSGGRGGRRC